MQSHSSIILNVSKKVSTAGITPIMPIDTRNCPGIQTRGLVRAV